ncbi:MAG: 3-isopropylmalate dehydratase small subunit [Parvularcula sp.]
MKFAPFSKMTGEVFVLDRADVDTDQIIPARFLTSTDRAGFGAAAFYDWRFDAAGSPLSDSPFAEIGDMTGKILVAGENFGCGSSREHAPWALVEFGCRIIISTKIADIFKGNALKNGLLAIEVVEETHRLLTATSGRSLTVDLQAEALTIDGREIPFSIDPFARQCLLDGTNALGVLLEALPQTLAFEQENGR